MTEPIVRPMTSDDILVIVEWMLTDPLWQRYEMRAGEIQSEFRGALERGDLLLVADADVPARGFAWCLLNGMFGTQAYLKRIGVDQACTGQNIGGLLLARIEELVIASNQDVLFLLVSDFNVGAQRFYRRHGYQQNGEFPGLAIPGVTELLFSREFRTLA
ncbi:hypothetical protein BH24CHL4_BH24CHL4_23300 [soil metagenome]